MASVAEGWIVDFEVPLGLWSTICIKPGTRVWSGESWSITPRFQWKKVMFVYPGSVRVLHDANGNPQMRQNAQGQLVAATEILTQTKVGWFSRSGKEFAVDVTDVLS